MTPEPLSKPFVTFTITADESADLARLEVIVERNMRSFLEVGGALLEIKDRRLYRANHPDFATYCRQRWKIGTSHAYRLIEAAQIADNVPIESERQARELSGLEANLQVAVHDIATEIAGEQPVTSTLLRQVRAGVEDQVADILGAHMTDPADGEAKPLSVLMRANVTKFVHETMQRQRENIRTSMDQKAARAHAAGQQKEVPAQPAPIFLMYLIRELTRAIEYVKEEKGALHPRYFAPYHLAKSAIGEALEGSEVSLLPDKVSVEGECERCGHGETVRDTVLTAQYEGHVKSLRIKLCDFCVDTYQKIVTITPNGEVVAR